MLPESRQFMAITSVYCHVSGAHVTRITDFEGRVTHLICPEYDEATGLCRIQREASGGGPLAQLLERTSEEVLDRPDMRCPLR